MPLHFPHKKRGANSSFLIQSVTLLKLAGYLNSYASRYVLLNLVREIDWSKIIQHLISY